VRGEIVEGMVQVSSHERPSEREALRLIVKAFVDCRHVPTVRLVAKQYRYETGKVPDLEEVKRAIDHAGARE
jgi:hypothetical protein